MNKAVDVTGLTVVRGGRTVLDDFDLDVSAGEVTGLLGPSGCGKSTLLRALVGVQKVAGGTVTVLGEPAGSGRCATGSATSPRPRASTTTSASAENLRFFARVLDADAARSSAPSTPSTSTATATPWSATSRAGSAPGSASRRRC